MQQYKGDMPVSSGGSCMEEVAASPPQFRTSSLAVGSKRPRQLVDDTSDGTHSMSSMGSKVSFTVLVRVSGCHGAGQGHTCEMLDHRAFVSSAP